MIDWEGCKNKFVKEITPDKLEIKSIQEIANIKIESVGFLRKKHYISKVVLLYDALRELLESFALSKGFKIYNHECYTYFLKEFLNLNELGEEFDSLRKIRNKINYYGKKYNQKESEIIINNLKSLIKKIKQLIKNKTSNN